MPFTYIRRAAVALALIATVGCTVHDTPPAPPLSGPSGLAYSLTVNANPDSIRQDGMDQSTVSVTVIGPDGRPTAKAIDSTPLQVRFDMIVNDTPTDFGSLSARTISVESTGTAIGRATVKYTAPPSSPSGSFGSCNSLPGTCVSIVATLVASTDFATANPERVQIRLMPPGVILPPAETLSPSFVVSPAAPAANSQVQFDASKSCGGLLVSGNCPANAPGIVSYSWNFGDGQAGTGKTVAHSFALQQPYTVTLTITNALGASASTSQVVAVGVGSLPKAAFTVSPQDLAVSQPAFFNAVSSTAGEGHSIVSYRWDFGDGGTGSGQTVTHVFAAAGSYNVQLTVADESGQTNTSATQTIKVGTGNPTAVLSVVKAGSFTVRADTLGSAAAVGSSLQTYSVFWGDGNIDTVDCGGVLNCAPSLLHTYAPPVAPATTSTFTVTLRVIDNAIPARNGSTTQVITVP